MAIEIKNVTKRFGAVTALNNIGTVFEKDCIYGLLGNNGAGKTTLMNVVTNRLFPDAGEILIDGESASGNDRALGKVFMMGENNMYPDGMKVNKAFAVTSTFYPDFDMEKANRLAGKFGLSVKKKITSLSTGYASIFRLILALSVNTPYLLLDEPVLGLDAQHRDMFYRFLMEKYTESPCTVVISTHLIHEIENIVEHTVIIKDGSIIKDAPMDELMADAYTVSGPSALVDDYIASRRVLSQHTLGGLKTACLQGEAGIIPQGLELTGVNLQDYFISLMGSEAE
ncbi:MAG: ABC transporter ATP-binding protein [Clostridia bacterium]|nr:ABC transporter ATP-binding protein [Clostridia bacterium]